MHPPRRGFRPAAGGVQVGTLIDDNAFNNRYQFHDRLTELSFQGAYDWESDAGNTQLFYNGSLNYFTFFPSRTFYVHETGLAYSRLYGEEGETLLNAGGTIAVRDNRDEFTIYDHTQISLYGSFRGYVSDLLLLKGGYTFRSVSFAELEAFDYIEHVLFLQGTISLPSRTTFLFQGDFGYKGYTTGNIDTAGATASGYGQKRRSADVSTPGVTQVTGTLRIGQGITDRTGLSLTGSYQLSLQKESRYLTFADGILTDDDLFDDHYGYEGPMASLMVTQVLPADLRLRVLGSLQERRYSNRAAFDIAGTLVAPQRLDRRSLLSISLDTTFPSIGLGATLVYDHIVNASNDAYYDYLNNALSLRFSFIY